MGTRKTSYKDVEWEDVEIEHVGLTDRSEVAKHMAIEVRCGFGRTDFAFAKLNWKGSDERIAQVFMEPDLDNGFDGWYANIQSSVNADKITYINKDRFERTLEQNVKEQIDMDEVHDMFEWANWDSVWTLYYKRSKENSEVAEAIQDIFEREGIKTKGDIIEAKSGFDPNGDFLRNFDVTKEGEIPARVHEYVDIYEKAGLDVEIRQRHTDPDFSGHFGIYLVGYDEA